ncbi:hypothetical protein B484DRAFT_65935 [Ochromonadaceae sp. CCMP2298]|nr:hypothetical protein B484DRAFT_65935 [Ochromonadaceae sp. CCMP2298]
MTLSDLAGHCSFLFLAFSYLENDLLHLRIFAISGISLSVVFQYYREKPLWIPIRWNSLFLVINAVMILLLLKDERDAGNIPEEERLLFENLFQNKGMKPVNFLHLISNAKRLELKKGDQIVSEKTLNTRVYLVKSGQLSMVKTGAHARPIGENQFVGSMSFLSWQNRVGVAKQEKKQREQTSKWGRMGVLGGGTREQGGEAVVSADPSKGNSDGSSKEGARGGVGEQWAAWLGNVVGPLGPWVPHLPSLDMDGLWGELPVQGSAIAAEQRRGGWAKNKAEDEEGEDGHANVYCEEDCVVYFWSFRRLDRLIEQYPSLGLAFERCLSEDLSRKMARSMASEPKHRYKEMIAGALIDGQTTDLSKQLLADYKEKHSISQEDHVKFITDFGWSLDEYETGFKGSSANLVQQEYMGKLSRMLASTEPAIVTTAPVNATTVTAAAAGAVEAGANGAVEAGANGAAGAGKARAEAVLPPPLTAEQRTELRNFRAKNGVREDTHLVALRRLGWTMDQFEVSVGGGMCKVWGMSTHNRDNNRNKSRDNSRDNSMGVSSQSEGGHEERRRFCLCL